MWKANISKEDRLIGQTGQMEAGKIVIPLEAPWLDDWSERARELSERLGTLGAGLQRGRTG